MNHPELNVTLTLQNLNGVARGQQWGKTRKPLKRHHVADKRGFNAVFRYACRE